MKYPIILLFVVLATAALSIPSFSGAAVEPVNPPFDPAVNLAANPAANLTVNPAVDLAAGEQVYAKCIACHSPDRNRTGPRHCGLLGRVSGSLPDYEYSEAMKAAKIRWSIETLNTFLQSPMTEVPGTTMGFAGVADPAERRNLIAWLATLSEDSPGCS